jgi:hypothetical protein
MARLNRRPFFVSAVQNSPIVQIVPRFGAIWPGGGSERRAACPATAQPLTERRSAPALRAHVLNP